MAVVIKSLGVELRDIKTEDLAVTCTSAMIELIGGHTWKEYRREENMSMGLVETAHNRS